MVLATMADLSGREEPVSTQELARLALILKRIEGTDKLRTDREQAAAKAARAKRRGGLSPEAVAIIRAEVEGPTPPPPPRTVTPPPPPRTVTSVPVDPWNPAESNLIPADPGESRPKNERRASQHIAYSSWLCPPPL